MLQWSEFEMKRSEPRVIYYASSVWRDWRISREM